MRVVLINSVCGIGSTGRICADLAKEFEVNGNEVKIAYGRDSFVPEEYQKYAVRIDSDLDVTYHVIYTRVTDKHGLASKAATRKFLKWLDEFKPDLLWLHNIHGYYINYEMLFAWIKKHPDLQVKWTLHDCWAFTGHCSHFSYVGCNKWKAGCRNCEQKSQYPASISDHSELNYKRKKESFCGIDNLQLIVPSNWLKRIVEESFLKEYPIEVHHNMVDKSIFKHVNSTIKEDYGIQNRKMILGVSSVWNTRKGFDDFIELSKLLDDSYRIVLVGFEENQVSSLPKNVIGIEKTNDISTLVKLYSAADVFVNPSKEETFGMTTAEAMACGTKAIVYKGTACEEVVAEGNGISVAPSVHSLYEEILKNI